MAIANTVGDDFGNGVYLNTTAPSNVTFQDLTANARGLTPRYFGGAGLPTAGSSTIHIPNTNSYQRVAAVDGSIKFDNEDNISLNMQGASLELAQYPHYGPSTSARFNNVTSQLPGTFIDLRNGGSLSFIGNGYSGSSDAADIYPAQRAVPIKADNTSTIFFDLNAGGRQPLWNSFQTATEIDGASFIINGNSNISSHWGANPGATLRNVNVVFTSTWTYTGQVDGFGLPTSETTGTFPIPILDNSSFASSTNPRFWFFSFANRGVSVTSGNPSSLLSVYRDYTFNVHQANASRTTGAQAGMTFAGNGDELIAGTASVSIVVNAVSGFGPLIPAGTTGLTLGRRGPDGLFREEGIVSVAAGTANGQRRITLAAGSDPITLLPDTTYEIWRNAYIPGDKVRVNFRRGGTNTTIYNGLDGRGNSGVALRGTRIWVNPTTTRNVGFVSEGTPIAINDFWYGPDSANGTAENEAPTSEDRIVNRYARTFVDEAGAPVDGVAFAIMNPNSDGGFGEYDANLQAYGSTDNGRIATIDTPNILSAGGTRVVTQRGNRDLDAVAALTVRNSVGRGNPAASGAIADPGNYSSDVYQRYYEAGVKYITTRSTANFFGRFGSTSPVADRRNTTDLLLDGRDSGAFSATEFNEVVRRAGKLFQFNTLEFPNEYTDSVTLQSDVKYSTNDAAATIIFANDITNVHATTADTLTGIWRSIVEHHADVSMTLQNSVLPFDPDQSLGTTIAFNEFLAFTAPVANGIIRLEGTETITGLSFDPATDFLNVTAFENLNLSGTINRPRRFNQTPTNLQQDFSFQGCNFANTTLNVVSGSLVLDNCTGTVNINRSGSTGQVFVITSGANLPTVNAGANVVFVTSLGFTGKPDGAAARVYNSTSKAQIGTLVNSADTVLNIPANPDGTIPNIFVVTVHANRIPLISEFTNIARGSQSFVNYSGWEVDPLVSTITVPTTVRAFSENNASNDLTVTTVGFNEAGGGNSRAVQSAIWGALRASPQHVEGIVAKWAPGNSYNSLDNRLLIDTALNLTVSSAFRIGPRVGTSDQQYAVIDRQTLLPNERNFVPITIRGQIVERFTAVGTTSGTGTGFFALLDDAGNTVTLANIDTTPASDVSYEFAGTQANGQVVVLRGFATTANPILLTQGGTNALVSVAELATLVNTGRSATTTINFNSVTFNEASPIVITTPTQPASDDDEIGALDATYLSDTEIDYGRFRAEMDASRTGVRVQNMSQDQLLGIRPATHEPS